MDLRKLKKLIDLVQESGIGEIEITEGEEKVRISRQAGGRRDDGRPAMQPMALRPGPGGGRRPAPAPPAAEPRATRSSRRWSGPSIARPRPGARLRRGRPVGLQGPDALHHRGHEAAERDRVDVAGTVKAILVENGQPVEYGQPLFLIE
jgi:acetyl-CoA carboxylase biotin carboxyl carrier protein